MVAGNSARKGNKRGFLDHVIKFSGLTALLTTVPLLLGGLLEYYYLQVNGLGQVFPLVVMDVGNLLPWFMWGSVTLIAISSMLLIAPWVASQADQVCHKKREWFEVFGNRSASIAIEAAQWLAIWTLIIAISVSGSSFGLAIFLYWCFALLFVISLAHFFRFGIGWAQALRILMYLYAYLLSLFPFAFFVLPAISQMPLQSDWEWLGVFFVVTIFMGFAYAVFVFNVRKYGFKRATVGNALLILLMFLVFLSFSNIFPNSLRSIGQQLGYANEDRNRFLVRADEMAINSRSTVGEKTGNPEMVWIIPDVAFSIGGVDVLCIKPAEDHETSGVRTQNQCQRCLVRRDGMASRWIIRSLPDLGKKS